VIYYLLPADRLETEAKNVGRIIASVFIDNPSAPDKRIRCDALVDTGVSHMVLPTAWKDRLGELLATRRVAMETATQKTIEGDVCGPVRLQIEGFPPVFTEVVFVEMEPERGEYEPLIGYIPLEQSQAAVDVLGHRLVHVKRFDLK
jgi:predicted aspartyl protease